MLSVFLHLISGGAMSTPRLSRCCSITRVLVSFALVFSLFISSAGVQAAKLEKQLDDYLTAAHDVWKFHGAALVAKDGKVILEKGCGLANIELGVPNTPEMKFQIGSITKQFTATAVMQLQEKGLLSVDDSTTKHLPDYPKETGDKVTIHHLLTHTSGIPSYTNMSEFMEKKAIPVSLEDLMATFKDKPLEFEPGERWNYSNSGYIVLGAIIEAVSGQTYEDYIRENIFEPLNMTNSGYDHRDRIIINRAAGYTEDENGELLNADFVHMSVPYAAGALYSTVGDMLLWDQALYTEKILKKSSLEKMFTPVKDNYGYGWMIRETYGRTHISHGGGINGFRTTFSRWVDDKACVVVLSNNDNAPVEAIAGGLAAIMFGEPYDMPVIKTPIEVDPLIFADYEGVYQVNQDAYRFITVEDSILYSQRSGGRRLRIIPEAEDKFYFEHDHTVTLKFVRDENGKVIKHIVHQMAEDQPAEKLEGEEAEKVLAEREAQWQVADVDPEIFEKYVGEYKLPIGLNMIVRTREGRIFSQATGQSETEIFPKSETEYFLKVVDAQITFVLDENGIATGLILHQAGQEFPGEKIK
jgi:CubicO group peptidase (beta-lactamase class C family)